MLGTPPLLLASAEFPHVLVFAHTPDQRAVVTYLSACVLTYLWENTSLILMGLCHYERDSYLCEPSGPLVI